MNVAHRALMIVLLVLASAAADAVHLSESGQGDALIPPYWTAQGGNDTLLTLRSSHDAPVAVKVRVMGADGAEVHALNVYLDARDTWTAGFSHFEDAPRLFSLDSSCQLPMLAQDAPFDTPEVELSAGYGYLEIIEMGVAEPGEATDGENAWQECLDLMQRLEAGPWRDAPNRGMLAPAGRISATVQIIDVAAGGMVAIDATALAGFSDIPQHTGPESDTPNLSTPNDSGAGSGKTRSRICTESECRTDAWDLPVEAVAAVLMRKAIEADVVINPAIGARTELVIVKPLERYKSPGMLSFISEPKLLLRRRDGMQLVGDGEPCVCITGFCCEVTAGWFAVAPLHGVIDVVSMNASASEVGMEQRSPILSAPTIPGFSLEDREFVGGVARVVFDQGHLMPGNPVSISTDDVRMSGEPVIGFVIQQFTNGTLIDADGNRIRANYRAAIEWGGERDLREN